MKNGNLRIALGVLLILLQLVSILGMIVANEPLLDSKEEDAYVYYDYVENTDAPGEMILGFYAGFLKATYAIQYLPNSILEHGQLPSYYYSRVAADLRAALAGGDGLSAVRLWMFELSIFLGFTFFATVGFFLLVSGIFAKGKWRSTLRKDYYVDKPLPIVKILLFLGSLLFIGSYILWDLQYLDWKYLYMRLSYYNAFKGLLWIVLTLLNSITLYDLATVVIFLALAVFFLFYQGKKRSVLPSFALMLYGATVILPGISSFASLLADLYGGISFDIIGFISGICSLLPGVLMLVAGLVLYFSGKKILPGVALIGALGLNFINFGLSLIDYFEWLSYDPKFARFPSFAGILFALIMAVYLFLPVMGPGEEKTKKPLPAKKPTPAPAAPAEPAPTLITTVPTAPKAALAPEAPPEQTDDSTVPPTLITPVTTTPQPAPVVPEDRPQFCGVCGKALTPGHAFCRYCGTKID